MSEGENDGKEWVEKGSETEKSVYRQRTNGGIRLAGNRLAKSLWVYMALQWSHRMDSPLRNRAAIRGSTHGQRLHRSRNLGFSIKRLVQREPVKGGRDALSRGIVAYCFPLGNYGHGMARPRNEPSEWRGWRLPREISQANNKGKRW